MPNLLRHTCASAKVARVAYDAEAKRLYVEFKPKFVVYAYEQVPQAYFDYIRTCRLPEGTFATEQLTVEELAFREMVVEFGVNPGSEGSFIVRMVVGTDRKNPPFTFRRLDDVEAAEIFPYEALSTL
jgi:KTSC domain